MALAAALFLPTPIIAAYPGFAQFLGHEWTGVPAAVLVIPAYLVLFMALASAFAGFSARMEA